MALSFPSCNALVEGLTDLVKNGRSYVTGAISGLQSKKLCREILGASCTLEGWKDREDVRTKLGEKNYSFLQTELDEWINPRTTNPGEAWRKDPETWAPFLKKDGTFQYTYNQRFFLRPGVKAGEWVSGEGSQLDNAKRSLVNDPCSRQAFVGIWNPYMDSPATTRTGADSRVPCTLGYQFFVRPQGAINCLEMVYYMRSLNVSWNLWNDLWLVTGLFEGFLKELEAVQGYHDVPAKDRVSLNHYGPIYFQVGSLHSFEDQKE